MTGVEPQTSGVGSDRSINCATTTSLHIYLFGRIQTSQTEGQRYTDSSHFKVSALCSVTRLGDFCFLGKHSRPVPPIILPKLLTLLGNFCKSVEIYHFSSEIDFGQLL